MNDQYCSSCGRQPVRETCCWGLGLHDRAEPCALVPALPWDHWNAEEQFLITLLMTEFGGAAEEWELLCRLPWPRYRLDNCVIDFETRPDGAALEAPCFREPDDRDRGRRYFVSDLARQAYERHRREIEAQMAWARGFPFGRARAPEAGIAVKPAVD